MDYQQSFVSEANEGTKSSRPSRSSEPDEPLIARNIGYSDHRLQRGPRTETSARCKTNASLILHFHVITHILSDVERATLLNKNRSEIGTTVECAARYSLERAGKRNLFDLTETETVFPDVLHAVRNFNSLEILAPAERRSLDPLQRGRKCNIFNRTLIKSRISKFFQSFIQLYALQLCTQTKRACPNLFHTNRKNNFFKTTVVKTTFPDNLETVWELDVPQARTILERVVSYFL